MRLTLGFLLFASLAYGHPWDCSPQKWESGPKIEQGRFQGTLESECFLSVKNSDPEDLRVSLKRVLMEWGNHNRNPAFVSYRNTEGWRFDHTIGTAAQEVRQELILVPTEKGVFLRAESLRLPRSLVARRELDIDVIALSPGRLKVSLKMGMEIKRPRMVQGPLYVRTGKALAKRHLSDFRDEFLPLLARAAAASPNALP